MFYPNMEYINNTRESTTVFGGYNHNVGISDGEFYDMKNLSSDGFPMMSPRKKRQIALKAEKYGDKVRGILCKDGKLAYLAGWYLHYDEGSYNLADYASGEISDDEILLSFNTYILIFPANIYFNTLTREYGRLGAEVSINGLVTATACKRTGDEIEETRAETAPEDPEDGDYWLNTQTYELYQWNENAGMWSKVQSTYIKLTIEPEEETDLTVLFEAGDAVYMNTWLDDINEGSVIADVGEDYIIVSGVINPSTGHSINTTKVSYGYIYDGQEHIDDEFYIERRIPTMTHVCVSQNRVWGCYAGDIDDERINEIYACKLGDPKNWRNYEGLASDSYSVSVGSDGEFTGAIEYQGYPTFFKENVFYRIYGNYPASYQLVTYDSRGVAKGCDNSLAIVNEYLLYKSLKDVCVFDGSRPVSISDPLGNIKYKNASGGSCMNKYYLSMQDEDENTYLFVYDVSKGLWHKEDDLFIDEFSYNNTGQLYGRAGDMIYGFGDASDDFKLIPVEYESEDIDWYAVTGEYGYSYPDAKYPGRIKIRAKIPFRSEIILSIQYDDGEWEEIETIRGVDTIDSHTISYIPQRCDHYRLRMSGHGEVKVLSITRDMEGGEDD